MVLPAIVVAPVATSAWCAAKLVCPVPPCATPSVPETSEKDGCAALNAPEALTPVRNWCATGAKDCSVPFSTIVHFALPSLLKACTPYPTEIAGAAVAPLIVSAPARCTVSVLEDVTPPASSATTIVSPALTAFAAGKVQVRAAVNAAEVAT